MIFVNGNSEPKYINKDRETILEHVLCDPDCCTVFGCYVVQVGYEILRIDYPTAWVK